MQELGGLINSINIKFPFQLLIYFWLNFYGFEVNEFPLNLILFIFDGSSNLRCFFLDFQKFLENWNLLLILNEIFSKFEMLLDQSFNSWIAGNFINIKIHKHQKISKSWNSKKVVVLFQFQFTWRKLKGEHEKSWEKFCWFKRKFLIIISLFYFLVDLKESEDFLFIFP